MLRPRCTVWLAGALALAFAGSSAWGAGATPKTGGVLNAMHREDPPSLSIHDESTISVNWGVMPCYNNLVVFNPLLGHESAATIVGDLAERWAWRDGGRTLVFTLRRGVRWHDGRPFSSADVKYTFDMVREAPGTAARLRLNPRKLWYAQVQAIEALDPATVIFRLKRPQPALLMMLASGYSPVYPAHIPPADLRTRCVGTGPFKLKEYRPSELIEYVRNPDYFKRGLPYLDGLRFVIIKERGTRIVALQAGRLDVAMPSETTGPARDQLRRAVPRMVFFETSRNDNDNILLNFKKPPFNDARLRRAVSLAIDRRQYIIAVRQRAALPGAAMLPAPWGSWGLRPADLGELPGTGDAARQKAEARQLLTEAGFGPGRPLRVAVSTRTLANYIDQATFVIDQLKQIGIDASLEQVESAVWYGKLTRGDYTIGSNTTGIGADDPDPNLYENFLCTSPRNYTQYCNPEIERMIDEQSQTLDPARRHRLVADIQKRLELDGARPVLGWNIDYFAMWPYVRNLVPHQVQYNFGRLEQVWLDR